MLPENVDFGAEVLSNYSRNTFRIEPNSSTSATAGRVIQITLPENSILDMKSLRLFMNIKTIKGVAAAAAGDILGILPANIESIISSIEVYVNGVQVAQGSNEYHTICKVLKLGSYNQDAQLSSGVLVNHAKMVGSLAGITASDIFGVAQAGAGEHGDVCIDNWSNFLGTTATRFIPTDVLGSVTIKITLASDSVLSGAIVNGAITAVALNNPTTAPSYIISNPYFTIDSCVLPDAYSELLRRRLLQDEYLPLNYKEYYVFVNSGITSASYSNRFALSSGCINALHAVQRLDSHNVFGAGTNLAPNTGARAPISAWGAGFEGKFFTYKTFKADADYEDGLFKYQFNVNNVAMPQFLATNKFAMANLPYVNNKLTPRTQGILVAGETAFCQGQAVYTCMLSHPDLSMKVMSGLNSRGINSQFYFNAQGLDTTKFPGGMSSVVIADTTAQLRIMAGRQISVVW